MDDIDHEALWNDSPELRDSVRADLAEWGMAQRGGLPDLGYPPEANFWVAPSKSAPCYDQDKIDAINDTLVFWSLEAREIEDVEHAAHMLRTILALRVHFMSGAPAESKARRFNMSRRSYYRMIDDAMYRFWRLHY